MDFKISECRECSEFSLSAERFAIIMDESSPCTSCLDVVLLKIKQQRQVLRVYSV